MKSVENFLDELASKPEAMAKLGQGEHKTKGDWLGALLEIGKAWGYDLTAEELTAALREKGEALRKRTDAQAEAVEALDDREMEQITGGRGDTCAVTYKDRENCPSTDGCDTVVNRYKSYNCFYNHRNPLLCPLDYIGVF